MEAVLTRIRYKRYMGKAKNAKTPQQYRDLLYTFLDYYRHIGGTIPHTESGNQYLHVIGSFQQVINLFHLEKPLVKLNTKTLRDAVKYSAQTMSLWFYVIHNRTISKKISVKACKSLLDASNKVESIEDELYKKGYKCLGIHFGKTNVYLTLIKPYTPKLKKADDQ